jgi:hypothetical protein
MEDFFQMVQTSTFAIFKIRVPSTTASSPLQQRQHESIGLYFLAVLPYDYDDDILYSLSWLPNKSNNGNNHNNKSIKSKAILNHQYCRHDRSQQKFYLLFQG